MREMKKLWLKELAVWLFILFFATLGMMFCLSKANNL
jgi:hypothetical protein